MEAFAAGGAWPGAVAVSGGGDSIALMHLLARWAKKTRKTAPLVLVVDHGLRPESASQARGVVKAAKAIGLAVSLLRWKAPASSGIEAAARQARYRLMGEIMRRQKLATLYVGHTQDDQAETFLLRLARGSGIDGLSAMRPLAPYPQDGFADLTAARPLLGFSRSDLRAWAKAKKLDWLEDPMNEDPRFDRVKMRRLAPVLAEVGLTPSRMALATMHLASASDLLKDLALVLQARASRPAAGGILLDQDALGDAPRELGLRVLASLLQAVSGAPYRPRFEALERLFDHLVSGTLGGGATLSGCRIAPAPAKERIFGPATLKITREKGRKTG